MGCMGCAEAEQSSAGASAGLIQHLVSSVGIGSESEPELGMGKIIEEGSCQCVPFPSFLSLSLPFLLLCSTCAGRRSSPESYPWPGPGAMSLSSVNPAGRRLSRARMEQPSSRTPCYFGRVGSPASLVIRRLPVRSGINGVPSADAKGNEFQDRGNGCKNRGLPWVPREIGGSTPAVTSNPPSCIDHYRGAFVGSQSDCAPPRGFSVAIEDGSRGPRGRRGDSRA